MVIHLTVQQKPAGARKKSNDRKMGLVRSFENNSHATATTSPPHLKKCLVDENFVQIPQWLPQGCGPTLDQAVVWPPSSLPLSPILSPHRSLFCPRLLHTPRLLSLLTFVSSPRFPSPPQVFPSPSSRSFENRRAYSEAMTTSRTKKRSLRRRSNGYLNTVQYKNAIKGAEQNKVWIIYREK